MPDTSAAGPLRAAASLAHLDGSAMLAALDAREISAAELLEQHIALIEARNPELNAVVSTDYAGARAAAAEVDRRRASGARSGGSAGTRVGLWLDDPVAPIDAETRAVLERFAQRLEAAGCAVTPLASPPVSGAAGIELFERLQEIELAHAAGPDAPPVLVDLRRVWGDWQEQRRIAAAWTRVFDEVDVVLAPTVPTVAPPHSTVPAGERMLSLDGAPHPAADVVGAWSRLANVGRGPSTVVPLGRGGASGLPVGAQLIGPYLEDFTPLQFAVLLEREGLVAFEAPPGW